ncbi:MAG TPA: 23S rRNA (uracil(1939)-C(5))-methyltransferase RlmD [Candidatus Sulfotelmatobacter sp.]|nr:23S rRNA (uracil(1939)-C(5))-methyltransferase RlmD [Candidatus Sulfotelmatobacter sp.]
MLLTVEKLIYGGDGLARLPADERGRGKAVFVPFVLSGEKVEAQLTEQKPGFARARVQNIVEPSPHRVAPSCPYFGECGGCHYQHADYAHQLTIKEEILRENLRRIAKLELQCDVQIHAADPWNYRNRTRLQIRTAPQFVTGYFRLSTHEVMSVEECPISSPLINRGIDALWRTGRAHRMPAGIHELEFFANADDSQLLVEVSCTPDARRAAVREWAELLRTEMPEISGVVAFRAQTQHAGKSGGRVPQPEKLLVHGDEHLIYKTQVADYRVSAGAFFQVNRYLTDELVKIVTNGQSGNLAVDLYSGVGLFSTALARDFRHVLSVESSPISTGGLQYNLPSNAEVIQAAADQFLSGSEKSGRVRNGKVLPQAGTPDLAVVDPPRGGLGERVAHLLAKLGAPRLVYVSCDVATLARDLVVLLAEGYRVREAHLVDLFPQTYHLETVLHMER